MDLILVMRRQSELRIYSDTGKQVNSANLQIWQKICQNLKEPFVALLIKTKKM